MEEIKSKRKVFVSYSSTENEEHTNAVVSFVDHLRKLGYDAQIDKKEESDETAAHFKQFMSKLMDTSDKVIVILSPSYKFKAENFKGGVGFEYRYILDYIDKDKSKFIIGMFKRKEDIGDLVESYAPSGFVGRETISLFDEQRLIRKLTDTQEFEFSPVAEETVTVKPKKIKPFTDTKRDALDVTVRFYDFENLFYHTIVTYETPRSMSYEVYRVVRVQAERLTELELKPWFDLKNATAIVSSPDFETYSLQTDEKGVARFFYPIPKDNSKGDVLVIQYKIVFEDYDIPAPSSYFAKCVNSCAVEIHDVVIKYLDYCAPAELQVMDTGKGSTDFLYQDTGIRIPFHERKHCFTMILDSPKVNTIYKMAWKQ